MEPSKADSALSELKDLSLAEAARLIKEQGNNPDLVILDIRTPAEYQSGHLVGAVNIDYDAADFRTRLEGLDRNKTYLIYCRTGNRSGHAMALMRGLNFQRVYRLSGGIVAWRLGRRPTIKE